MCSVLDQEVEINLQENDIVTFLAAMLSDLSFQTVGNFSCITLQIIYLLKCHIDHWYEPMPLIWLYIRT